MHGYSVTPNYHLYFAAYKMALFLERHGFVATALPSGPGGGGAPFSHRHAAVAAGLAEFGWNNLVVSPDYGPRIRWVSVITRAELEPDVSLFRAKTLRPESMPRLCGRLSGRGDQRHQVEAVADRGANVRIRPLEHGEVPDLRRGPDDEEPGARGRAHAQQPDLGGRGRGSGDAGLKPGPGGIHPVDHYYCGRCLAYCPIGNEEERRLSSGLSSAIDQATTRTSARTGVPKRRWSALRPSLSLGCEADGSPGPADAGAERASRDPRQGGF